jgi:hypothetical protein
MMDRVVVPLRVFLVLLFAGLVFAQVVSLPGQFGQLKGDGADLRWPLTVFSILEVVCVQVVIVCIWRLLTLVKADRIFSEKAFGWVNVILVAMVAGWVLLLGMTIYLSLRADDPGLPILLIGLVLAGGVVLLLMVVMRALLRQATTLQTDMEAVI